MKHYVVGFVFDPAREHVLMVRKNRPTFQAGLLNGVGGKVEPHETSHAAMVRECVEESNLHISDWRHVASVCAQNYQIDVWSAVCDLSGAQTITDEPVEIHSVHDVFRLPCLHNLPMLLAIARDISSGHKPIWIYE
jgi:8-oxo-dGTP pyrophosphatase MutT (NUDIX family)